MIVNNKEFLQRILEGQEVPTMDGLVARLLKDSPETMALALEQFYDNNDNDDVRDLDHILNELIEGEW